MAAIENVFLQTIDMKLSQVIGELHKVTITDNCEVRITDLPEWITLEKAVQIKGGGAYQTYKTSMWLQPCCGLNARRVAGRKVWQRDDVLEWLGITDDLLWEYAKKWGAKIQEKYRFMAKKSCAATTPL